MSANGVIVIAKSNRPRGLYRAYPGAPIADLPTVPLECIKDSFDRVIGENRVHQRELRTGTVLGYIQDAIAALDIIEHSLFLYVETTMSFHDFLVAYAAVPSQCPACEKEIDEREVDERLAHIIRCRWKTTRQIIAAAAKATEPPKLLH